MVTPLVQINICEYSRIRCFIKMVESRQTINITNSSDKWLIEKRTQTPNIDTIRQTNNYLASLKFLVGQHPNNVIALDYLLCYYLLNKDLKSFKKYTINMVV